MKKILLLLAAITFMTACSKSVTVTNTSDLYAKTATVTEINREEDTVTVTDGNGNDWCFYGYEDWEVGDVCSMLMDTNRTESIYDDIIVDVRYDTIYTDSRK